MDYGGNQYSSEGIKYNTNYGYHPGYRSLGPYYEPREPTSSEYWIMFLVFFIFIIIFLVIAFSQKSY